MTRTGKGKHRRGHARRHRLRAWNRRTARTGGDPRLWMIASAAALAVFASAGAQRALPVLTGAGAVPFAIQGPDSRPPGRAPVKTMLTARPQAPHPRDAGGAAGGGTSPGTSTGAGS